MTEATQRVYVHVFRHSHLRKGPGDGAFTLQSGVSVAGGGQYNP